MKLLSVGDNVIDYYVNTGEMYPGGNAVNVAVHASKIGVDAAYMGNLGTDSMSDVIRRALEKFQVETKACVTIAEASTKYCNYEVIDGERKFCNVVLGKQWSGPMILNDLELEYAKSFDVLYSSCNAKMEKEMWKLSQMPPVFAYDFGEKEKYRTEDYLGQICSGLDLALFSCLPMTEEEALHFCERIASKGTKHVLITMGKTGQYVYNGSELVYGEAKFIKPVDTMGAGDSFLAAFIYALYQEGWRKGMHMPVETLKKALIAGRDYSAENCKVEGAFGYKEIIHF